MLAVEDLDFAYGRIRRTAVFKRLSWCPPLGAKTLLLGPNGAGKSTLLKLLCGVLRPNAGHVTISGHTDRKQLFKDVGWVPQQIEPLRGLTVREQVSYTAWISGLDRRESDARTAAALEAVRLLDLGDRQSSRLSGGQLRRLGLAQALTTNAPVMLLDEPTAGLDPSQVRSFRGIVEGLEPRGGLVVSTHQVSDLWSVFDHVTILARGAIRFDGSVNDFYDFGETLGVGAGTVGDIFAAACEAEE